MTHACRRDAALSRFVVVCVLCQRFTLRGMRTAIQVDAPLSARVFSACLFHALRLTHMCACNVARAVLFSRQVLEKGRNGAHSPISLHNLSGSTARCHANHNSSRQWRGLTHRRREAAPRLHACAIAHASFFLPLLQRDAHSTSLFEMY